MPDVIRDPDTGEEWVRGPGGHLHRPCPSDCVGGYRFVSDLYAAGLADPAREPARYQAALNSVYPCSTCRPEVYALWEAEHMRPEHLAGGGCSECKPTPVKASRR